MSPFSRKYPKRIVSFEQYVRTVGFRCIRMKQLGDFVERSMLRCHNEVGGLSFRNFRGGIPHSDRTDWTAEKHCTCVTIVS